MKKRRRSMRVRRRGKSHILSFSSDVVVENEKRSRMLSYGPTER